ncbi:hypothetical protein [Acinetobacter tibetensis]|uniref:Uncharacterized protein n=1 Tax=Acinetobacter tibetensis TaxID=2943497 RepID=A0AAE9LSP0_9GAMM|nr:hypothetical protein [Acinetobacter tibetensis]USE84060.1 hypothetical protein M5E07_04350 [Acinetobacter tibetensis]
MAFLIEGIKLDENLSLDMFYPESFRTLDELLIFPEENLIVVKELWSGKPCDTFFTLDALERIDPFKRYNQENGKALIEIKGDLTIVTTVTVERGTMAEYLFGSIFKNNQQIFKSLGVRYSSIPTKSTYQKYLDLQFSLMTSQKSRESFFEEFSSSLFDDKVNKLRGIFRSNFRSNCQIGYFPPEHFLTQELFNVLDHDKEFRKALFKVLLLEEAVTNEAASVVFKDLITHYLKEN